jgi:GNAT superfamily N-acetyltransferase
VTVRVAGVEDAATLGRLLEDFNVEFETETDPADVLAARFARLLAGPAAYAVLAEDGADPRATGFGLVTLRPVVWFDGPAATLDELYVVPDRRDRGTGSALLAAARAEARRRGCPEMHINVDEVDVDTRRFYERHGFVNVEEGTDYRMLCYTGPA